MKLTTKSNVTFTFHLIITEGEMRALDALVGYGFEPFLKTFYQHMGKSYLEPHEKDLYDLFNRIAELKPHLAAVTDSKKSYGRSG